MCIRDISVGDTILNHNAKVYVSLICGIKLSLINSNFTLVLLFGRILQHSFSIFSQALAHRVYYIFSQILSFTT